MFNYIKEKKGVFALFLIATPIAVVLDVGLAILLRWITDAGISGNEFLLPKLIWISVIYIVLVSISDGSYRYSMLKLTNYATHAVRRDLFQSIFKRPLSEIRLKDKSYYVSMFLNDLENLKDQYFKYFCFSYHEILYFVVSIALLLKIDLIMAVTILVFAFIQLIIPIVFEALVEKKQEDMMEFKKRYTADLLESINNFNIIKLFRRETIFSSKNESTSKNLYNACVRKDIVDKGIYVLSFSASIAMYLGSMLVGIWLVFRNRITIGQVIEASQLMAYVTGPMLNFTDILTSFKSSKPIIEKLNEHLLVTDDEYSMSTILKDEPFEAIEFKNVSFKYPSAPEVVLCDCNIRFERGKKYLIIGDSGSGKSTLFKLLQKSFNKYDGEITFNGVDIRNILDSDYYSRIAFCLQDSKLFTASIRDNITLFENSESRKLKKVMTEVGLDNFINHKENGLDTIISDNNNDVSGGEKQRISVARTLLNNFDVVCLDESTSSLDKASGEAVENYLMGLKDKTVIIIAHHYSEAIRKQVDHVFILDDGKLKTNE